MSAYTPSPGPTANTTSLGFGITLGPSPSPSPSAVMDVLGWLVDRRVALWLHDLIPVRTLILQVCATNYPATLSIIIICCSFLYLVIYTLME